MAASPMLQLLLACEAVPAATAASGSPTCQEKESPCWGVPASAAAAPDAGSSGCWLAERQSRKLVAPSQSSWYATPRGQFCASRACCTCGTDREDRAHWVVIQYVG